MGNDILRVGHQAGVGIDAGHDFAVVADDADAQAEIARRVGFDRSTVANSLRLLKLPEEIQEMVEDGGLSGGHARTLLSFTDDAVRLSWAKQAAAAGLSVRDLEQAAFRLLADVTGLNFVGNVEGRDLGRGRCDVFVTDGYTGNVLLKTSEGTSRALFRVLMESLQADEYQSALAELLPAFMELRQRIDP